MTRAAMALMLLAIVPAPARAAEWTVSGRLLGPGDARADDVSGIACSGLPPRDCLVVDDETRFAQWLTVGTDRLVAGETLKLIDDRFDGDVLELDGEAVAYSDGAFFVTGSFGAARRSDGMHDPEAEARREAASHVFRIVPGAVRPTIEESSALRALILADSDLAPFADAPLADNGVTIEGIAVIGDTGYLGFRGPVLDGETRAAVLQLPLARLFGASDGEPAVRRLPLGPGRGVRDLSAVDDAILVLAGPMRDTDAGDAAPGAYSIHRWDPRLPDPASSAEMEALFQIPTFRHDSGDTPDKPEAILPLGLDGQALSVLVLFDGPKEGAPRSFTFDWTR